MPSLFGGIAIPNHPDLENVRRLDLLPIGQIRRMERMGIAIDPEWFRALSSQLESKKAELRKDVCNCIPPDKLEEFADSGDEIGLNVDSSEQIAKLLFDLLKVGRGKRLRTTKGGNRISTGRKQLEALKGNHPVIPLILSYRECSKLKNTYTDKLPKIAVWHQAGNCPICESFHWESHYRIHTRIISTITDTGRLASRQPNLQNIPAKAEIGREVRKGFIAQKGCKLVSCDFSQFELRLLADRSQDENMIRIFRAGGDIHLDTAMRAFNISDPTKVDKLLHRAPCKNVNFGLLYGLTAQGLYELLILTFAVAGLPQPEWLAIGWCEKFIAKWFTLYPQCREYLDLQHYRARRYGIVWTACGRVRRVPEVVSCHNRIHEAGLRQAGNHPIQGWQADIFKIAMARVENRLALLRDQGLRVEALLPVHDELVSEVEEDWADEARPMIEWEMAHSMDDQETGECLCRVPVCTDGKVMGRWEK